MKNDSHSRKTTLEISILIFPRPGYMILILPGVLGMDNSIQLAKQPAGSATLRCSVQLSVMGVSVDCHIIRIPGPLAYSRDFCLLLRILSVSFCAEVRVSRELPWFRIFYFLAQPLRRPSPMGLSAQCWVFPMVLAGLGGREWRPILCCSTSREMGVLRGLFRTHS